MLCVALKEDEILFVLRKLCEEISKNAVTSKQMIRTIINESQELYTGSNNSDSHNILRIRDLHANYLQDLLAATMKKYYDKMTAFHCNFKEKKKRHRLAASQLEFEPNIDNKIETSSHVRSYLSFHYAFHYFIHTCTILLYDSRCRSNKRLP